MNINELQSMLTIGETVAVEFKRCGNGIENDAYETVCSFLNRFGGDLFWVYWMMEQWLVYQKKQPQIW